MEDPEGIPPVTPQEPAFYPRELQAATPPPLGDEPPEAMPAGTPLERAPTAWVLLFVLFAVLIAGTITQVRKPSLGQDVNAYVQQETEIKAAMKQKRIVSLMPMAGSDSNATRVPKDTLNELRKAAATDPRAARLLVGAEYESGDTIPVADLNLVTVTRQPRDNDFATIYRSKKLTEDQARQLTARFPSDDFSYSLARIHAFDKAGDPRPRTAMSPAWKVGVVMLAVVGAFAAIGLGVLLWIFYFVLRADGRLPKPQHPAEPLSLAEADRFAYRAVLFIGLFLLVSLIFQGFKKAPPSTIMFGEYTAMIVGVVLLHKIRVIGLPLPLSRIGVSTKGLFKNIGWGIVGYIMALPGLAIALAIGFQLMKIFGVSTHPAAELAQNNPNLPTILALYFAAAMVAPFWEEIMFRGTVLPALSRVLGKPVWGILLSSFMFAAIHPQGIPLWLALGFIGGMSGMLAYHTRSLVPSMVLHALNNALVITLALLMS